MTQLPGQAAVDPDALFAEARLEIAQGQGAAAVAKLERLIAGDDAPPPLIYWLAAARGAAGDDAGFARTLKIAQTQHARALIESCGGDLERMDRDPAYATHLGETFYGHGHVAVASTAYQAANGQALTPQLSVLIAHGLSLQHQGRIDEALAVFQRACQMQPDSAAVRSFLLYCLFYVDDGVRRHAEEARRCGRAYAEAAPKTPLTLEAADPAGRPLRIGYVAPSVAGVQVRQFLSPVLEHHDPERVEVFLYLQNQEEGPAVAGHTVRPIGRLDDDQAARLIREDRIDVLIDLWGHTAGGRLGVFVRRPAPVQVSWLNYVQTTGVEALDYVLHPDGMAAPGDQDQFVETIWRIGPHMAPFRPDPRPAPVDTPALANGFITFGSYNHPARLKDQTVAGWARVLRAAPGSQLLLRYKYYADEVLQNTTLMRFAAHGIDPSRIVFEGHIVQPAYYESYSEIDIALDPAPCPGGTTSCDVVANGVPLLTMAGPDYFGRMGVALLRPMGLEALIASDWDDYVERAAALAADVQGLNALRRQVRERFERSGRRDEAGFTRNLEDQFARMYALWWDARQATPSAKPAALTGT